LAFFCFGVNRSGFPQHAGGEGKLEAFKNHPWPGRGKENMPWLRDKPGGKEGKMEFKRTIGDKTITIVPFEFGGGTVTVKVTVKTPTGAEASELVKYGPEGVTLWGRAAQLLGASPSTPFKLGFGPNAKQELEKIIASWKLNLLKQGLEVLKGPVTIRRIVGSVKIVLFVDPKEPRSALEAVQEAFAPLFSSIANNPSFLQRPGVTLGKEEFDDYSFTQDFHFAPGTFRSLLEEWIEKKRGEIEEVKAEIEKIRTLSPEEAVQKWWISAIHVNIDENRLSDCPPYCDDCIWERVWSKEAPKEVKAIAPIIEIMGRGGKVYSYRRVDERSFRAALKHPAIEEKRAAEIAAAQARLDKLEKYIANLADLLQR